MTKNITKFHAKGWFQKCVLCHLAMGDSVGASEAAENASMQDPRFPQGREGAFVLKIVELCKERSNLKENISLKAMLHLPMTWLVMLMLVMMTKVVMTTIFYKESEKNNKYIKQKKYNKNNNKK